MSAARLTVPPTGLGPPPVPPPPLAWSAYRLVPSLPPVEPKTPIGALDRDVAATRMLAGWLPADRFSGSHQDRIRESHCSVAGECQSSGSTELCETACIAQKARAFSA